MALIARNLALLEKLTLSSCNYLKIYTSIGVPYKFCYNLIHKAVAHGGNYEFNEIKDSLASSHHLDIRKTFSDAKEDQTSEKVVVYEIQKAYGDLTKELNLKNTDSNLGKTVKYILSKNIRINEWNMRYSQHTSVKYINKIKKDLDFPFGRFTPNEDEVIKNKWNGLCCECGIENPQHLLRELEMNVSSKVLRKTLQLNVIGCYLDPDLKKARHATEVAYRAMDLLSSFVTGKFKPEEDKIILQVVEKNGDNIAVFKDLCLKLNRNPIKWANLKKRYKTLIQRKAINSGKWTIDEDKLFIETLFANKKLGIDAVNSVHFSDYKHFHEIRRGPWHVHGRYERHIKPILLRYHYEKLGSNSNYDFMSYVVKNKITSVQEIQWKEVLKLFPYETRESLSIPVSHVYHRYKNSSLDHLYMVFQEHLNYYKENGPTENKKEFQSSIVEIYLNCKT
jgi:hypothetical protein